MTAVKIAGSLTTNHDLGDRLIDPVEIHAEYWRGTSGLGQSRRSLMEMYLEH